jgi:hypothetical protein
VGDDDAMPPLDIVPLPFPIVFSLGREETDTSLPTTIQTLLYLAGRTG